MEQILIRNLPEGTKAALGRRARAHRRSVEAEARVILAAALERPASSLADLLSSDAGAEIEFDPERLGAAARIAEI